MQKESRDARHNITVAVKLRPLLPKETANSEFEIVKVDKNLIVG